MSGCPGAARPRSGRSCWPACWPCASRSSTRRSRSCRGSRVPTQLDIDEARARWREIAAEDAGLGPIAAFHDERLAQLSARPAVEAQLDLTHDEAAAAIASGTPLLVAGRLAFDVAEVAGELARVARDLADTAELGSAGQRAALALAGATVDVAPLLAPTLQGEHEALATEAARLGVDAATLASLVELAVQPVLWEAASQAASLAELDRWDRGYCVLCGAWPALAELVGGERRRVLRCVRCGSGWSWLVLLCPYCGTDDHRELGALHEAQSGSRIDTCARCHGYVKAISTFTSFSALRIVAEDAATVHLDVGAAEAGYQRPGTVDPLVAGIPRLAREGQPPD